MTPTLKLTFLRDDIDPSHSLVQVIDSFWIVARSISIRKQLLNGLKPSSNTVTLQIVGSCPSVEDMIGTDGDVRAELDIGGERVFTGFLSHSWSWSVTATGQKNINITLEDVGTRLLGREFISRGEHLFDCTADDALLAVCDAAGVTASSSRRKITTKVFGTVSEGTSCRDILEKLLYETGHVYFFNSNGELDVFSVDPKDLDKASVVDKGSLVDSVSLSKTARQYRSARVSYTELGTIDNLLVYRNTSGKDDSHPFCHHQIPGHSWFDGTEVYPESEKDSHTKALVAACNAGSESEQVASARILSVSNVSTTFLSESSYLIAEVKAAGGPYLSIDVSNADSLPHHVTRLDATATAVYEKSTEVIRTADTVEDGESDNMVSEDLSFIYDRTVAQAHANRLCQYHRHCSTKYRFKTRSEIQPGAIIHLKEDVFSGIDTHVMVTESTHVAESSVWSYGAVGIARFSLDDEVTVQRTKDSLAPVSGNGRDGRDGEDSITVCILSTNGLIFRRSDPSFTTKLMAKVFQGGVDITDTIVGNRFRWTRTSSDPESDRVWNNAHYALSGSTLAIGKADTNGPCSFYAEYIRDDNIS